MGLWGSCHLASICNLHEHLHCFCSLFFSVFSFYLHSCWSVALWPQRQDVFKLQFIEVLSYARLYVELYVIYVVLLNSPNSMRQGILLSVFKQGN